VFLKTWIGNGWQQEITARSADIRKTHFDPRARRLEITYEGESAHEEGLKQVGVRESFYLTDDDLRWDIELTNRTDQLLEIGEVAFPFAVNTDYAALFRGPGRLEDESQRQQEWHESKVMLHLCVSGHSSYALLQRPLGDFPCLMVHTLGDTALEAAYKADNAGGSQWDVVWEGPYLLATQSWARKQEWVWQSPREPQRSWINGHTYLLLEPGQSKTFRFRFVFLERYSQVGEELYRYGQVAVRVQPGMVVPVGQYVNLQLKCRHAPVLIPEADDVEIQQTRTQGDCYQYRLRFRNRGQKKVRVSYGDGKWTNLFFYALPPFEDLLKARASFIVERQLYDNPSDPYGRYHAFLPYDNMLETLFLDSDEAWQVGGSDEYSLPIAMYLAEKNVYYPNAEEVEALETYIDDFLFKHLQDPNTYMIRRGMYWFEEHPSRQPMHWDKETAELTTRTFNYPLVANIYHAMFRIGRMHGPVKRRTSEEYLDMCWRTAMKWFETGRHGNYGAPAGGNVVNILNDLEREDRQKYEQLYAKMKRVAGVMEDTPYPFGSELFVDQTGHDQVYAMMKRFGRREKMLTALPIIKALRAGAQPVWFWYGNEKRGNVSCWYAQTQNSRCLLSGYEETGDHEMLAWGYGGLTSFLTTVQSNGSARGWFLWWPDRMGFDLRSLDTDLGLYGYLLAAKSYVVDDEAFGIVGYGCSVERDEVERWRVTPWDGLRKRLALVPLGIDVAAEKGEIAHLEMDRRSGRLCLELEDSTGLVGEAFLSITGVDAAKCSLANGSGQQLIAGDGDQVRVTARLPQRTRVEIVFR